MPTARDVMSNELVTIPHTAIVERAIQVLMTHSVDSAPVVDDCGKLLGVVSEAQLFVVFYDDDARDEPITAFLTDAVESIAADAPLAEVGKKLNRSGAPRLAVLEEGRLVGMVSRADLMHHIAIVGVQASACALAGSRVHLQPLHLRS